MNNISSQISSIIPTMILGIFLILAWFPAIIITELNNKHNKDEYKQLLTYIKDKILTLTLVTLDYTPLSTATSGQNLSTYKLGEYYTVPLDLINNNNNLYLRSIIETITTTTESPNKTTTTTTIGTPEHLDIGRPSIGGTSMTPDDYRYLAMQTKIKTETFEKKDGNITKKYIIDIYSIPANTQIYQVGGLQEHATKLGMTIYNYEFGPEEIATETIKKRKLNADFWERWLARLGTFLMLAGGLTSIVSPLRTLNNLLGQLPWFFNIIAVPGQIILSIWDALSIFGSLLLTALMTLLVWTVINQPMYAIIIISLIAGLSIYFKYKK